MSIDCKWQLRRGREVLAETREAERIGGVIDRLRAGEAALVRAGPAADPVGALRVLAARRLSAARLDPIWDAEFARQVEATLQDPRIARLRAKLLGL